MRFSSNNMVKCTYANAQFLWEEWNDDRQLWHFSDIDGNIERDVVSADSFEEAEQILLDYAEISQEEASERISWERVYAFMDDEGLCLTDEEMR